VSLREAIGSWIRRQGLRLLTHRCQVHGFPTVIVNTRPEIRTEDVIARLEGALALLKKYMPHHYRRLRRDFSGFLIERRAHRGAFIVASRTCLVELTFIVNPSFTLSQVAATVLHEAMHARLYARGIAVTQDETHRQERFCRRAEIEFGEMVPDGAPIVQRAMESLQLSDAEIAPVIDQTMAAKRVLEADLAVSTLPMWYKQRIARAHCLPASSARGQAAEA
jgi:hypothetical protein